MKNVVHCFGRTCLIIKREHSGRDRIYYEILVGQIRKVIYTVDGSWFGTSFKSLEELPRFYLKVES